MSKKVGVWLIGAYGGVATTAIVGLVALQRKLTENHGLVSELPQFQQANLIEWDNLVVGGHDIRKSTLATEANQLLNDSRLLSPALLELCQEDFARINEEIRPGIIFNVGKTITSLSDPEMTKTGASPRDLIESVKEDLKLFASTNNLSKVIVMNVSSTEPTVDASVLPAKWDDLDGMLDSNDCPLAASSLYAIAALQSGMPYLNFTPSLGTAPDALCELAEMNKVCHMGHDGKTGETLLKSALAPMFQHRNLNIMSWVGHNIFGNMDGKVLDDPENKKTKVVSKDKLLGQILGYDPQTHISIEYIKSLGDWKTAWDHIHFEGFLSTPMVMQFTWQGSDSILAAPLVLDLVRFTELAHRRGETGLLKDLCCFFKSPLGVPENNFVKQFQLLEKWATR
ncbi:inositol-3-phosphate synthase [Mariniblastus sp.]|jgi:myo-inositol-1-phosphate synthase|nr:inositol-3-phosphate synthase [Mariniblastus sp.]MDB4671869.1 inositol-3-phosphate synthase [Pirellulaceae bacterium]MDB4755991.1 inositol-3-phosphate synthase [Mariniblastus sp.]